METKFELDVENLVVGYPGSEPILNGLSLQVRPGAVCGILGRNGCGKTTLFRALTGLVVPSAGILRLNGQELPFGDSKFRRQCGVLFQELSLDVRLSARRNLELNARLWGLKGHLDVDHILDLVGLSERSDQKVSQFSGGMKRRLDLARILLHRPRYLLLDEPTTGFDQENFSQAWSYLKELVSDTNAAVIVASHRPEEADLCDQVFVVDQGRVVAAGSPEALKRKVKGDVITLKTPLLDNTKRLLTEMGLCPEVRLGSLVIEHPDGHRLVPKIFDHLPERSIDEVTLHRPTLAEAFFNITGKSLERQVVAT